jgi:hypothetical protein
VTTFSNSRMKPTLRRWFACTWSTSWSQQCGSPATAKHLCMDADDRPPGGESGHRTAAAGLPVAARRARSEVPVIATVIAVAM